VLPTMKSNIQVLTNQKKLDLLEQRLLNGEIPADIYRELKEKYADKTHSENLHQKKADTSYIM